MAKGGSGENLTGRELSLLWSKGERNDLTRRTEGSGSRYTKKKQKGEEGIAFQAGDLTFSDPIMEPFFRYFLCENKCGYSRKSKTKDGIKVVNWCILDILDSKQKEPMFLQMWNQCKRDALLSNREPLLIFRRDNMQICIAFENHMYGLFYDYFGFQMHKKILLERYPDEDIIIMNFNDWKSWVREGLEAFVNIQLNKRNNQ